MMLLYPGENRIFKYFQLVGCQGTSDSTAAWVKIAFRLDNSGAFIPPQNGWLELPSHLTAAKRERTHVDCCTNIQNNKHHLSSFIMDLHRSSAPSSASSESTIQTCCRLRMPQLIQLIA